MIEKYTPSEGSIIPSSTVRALGAHILGDMETQPVPGPIRNSIYLARYDEVELPKIATMVSVLENEFVPQGRFNRTRIGRFFCGSEALFDLSFAIEDMNCPGRNKTFWVDYREKVWITEQTSESSRVKVRQPSDEDAIHLELIRTALQDEI